MTVRWDCSHKTRHGHFFGTYGDLRNHSGLHFRHDWYDLTEYGCAVEWGNGNSDPIWCFHLTVQVPPWWVRRCERRWARKDSK